MIGASRETVTRLLSDLRKKQLIRLEGSTLVIRNRVALEALVSCQASYEQDRWPVPPKALPPKGGNKEKAASRRGRFSFESTQVKVLRSGSSAVPPCSRRILAVQAT